VSLKVVIAETGVDLFFILSGYLIWTSAIRTLDKPGGLYTYFVHRVTRIAPLYYVALVAVLVATPLFIGSWKPEPTQEGIIRHIWFGQSFAPSVSREINPVLWTLTHEALFYLLVPVLFLMRSSLWALLPISLSIALAAQGGGGFGFISPFLQLFFLFAIGFTMANYQLVLDWKAAVISIVAVLALWDSDWHLLSPVCAFAIFACMTALPDLRSLRILFKPLSLLGIISYSLYVWHYVAGEIYGPQVITHYTPLFRIEWLYSAVFVAFVFALSTASYFLLEKPGMTHLRDLLLKLPDWSKQKTAKS